MSGRRLVALGGIGLLVLVWASGARSDAGAAGREPSQPGAAGPQAGAAGPQTPSSRAAPTSAPTGQVIEGIAVDYNGAGVGGARVRVESPDSPSDAPALAETTTNNLGEIRVQLPRPVSGPVRVRIEKEGYAPFEQEVDPTDPDNPAFVDATLEGTGRLSGQVTEAGTGRPLPGARVECVNGGRRLTTLAEAEGRFSFTGMVRGPAELVFMADGFGADRKRITIGSFRVDVTHSLRPERPIELAVEDNEGRPAANVTIEGLVEPAFDLVTATTDAVGRARLRGVSADATAVRLRLNGPRYVRCAEFSRRLELGEAASQPGSGHAPVAKRFVVRVAGGVRGTVVDAKTREPIVGVRVIAGREVRGNMPMAWTNDEGGYALDGLEPGINVISMQHSEHATAIREVRVSAGSSAVLDAALSGGEVIGGVVVDEEGHALDQVRVSAESWQGYTTVGIRLITGEDGRFQIAHAPAGEVTFSFVRPGYGPAVEQVLESGKGDYRIALPRAESSAGDAGDGRRRKLRPGEAVPDIVLTATDGTRYALSKLKGQYVFLDCWASWCGPCVQEIPNLKALRAAVKDRTDFVMIGISLDTNRSAFDAAVRQHGMDWPQAFGPGSGAQEAFDILNGYGIPYMCLIGPDGSLVADALRGPGLANDVKQRLPRERR